MKLRMLGVVTTMFAFVAPAAAAQVYERGALPPVEILGIVRDGGFDPLGQPLRRGPNYVLHAVDEDDHEVRMVINARTGQILSVTPSATAMRLPPAGSIGPYERMAPRYVPPGAYRGAPPVVYEDDVPVVYGRPPVTGTLPPGAGTRGPIPPAEIEDDSAPDGRPLHSTELPPPAGPQDGLLPPPPERFPQRAAPATTPNPKPVKRAAAGPAKSTPLPKPKPAAQAAPPEPAPQVAPSSPQPNAAPEETPH
jgi:hypothetical protein